MTLKIVRQRMMDVGPVPDGCRRESTQDKELIRALLTAKSHEETQKLPDARTPGEQLTELGDMLEVVRGLGEFYGLTLQDIIDRADVKVKERGGFVQRIAGTRDRFTADLLRRIE